MILRKRIRRSRILIISQIIFILSLFNKGMNIVCYAPNIISYIRIGLVIYAFYNFDQCLKFMAFYTASFVAHGIGNIVGKSFKQKTAFGDMVSMIIDRGSTGSLLIMLTSLYPDHKLLFIGSMILDITSHWYLVNSSLAIKLHSHRNTNEDALINIYYQIPLLIPMIVMFCEQFYLMYYIGHFMPGLWNLNGFTLMFHISGGVYLFKQIIHILQIKVSLQRYIKMDQNREENDKKKN